MIVSYKNSSAVFLTPSFSSNQDFAASEPLWRNRISKRLITCREPWAWFLEGRDVRGLSLSMMLVAPGAKFETASSDGASFVARVWPGPVSMHVFQVLRGKAITHNVPHTPTPLCEVE
jgi:hypothetical protein